MRRVLLGAGRWRGIALGGVVAIAFCAFAVDCRGQEPGKRHFEFYAGGGASTINDATSESFIIVGVDGVAVANDTILTTHVHPGARFLGGFRYFLTPRDAFEASYSYAPTNITITLTDTLITSTGTSTSVILLPTSVRSHLYSFNYVRRFRPTAKWQPYLTAGVGGVHWQAVQNAAFVPGFGDGFTGNFGGGINWKFSEHWSVQAEYRDYLMSHPRFERLAPGGMSHDQAPTVGLTFRF